MKTILVTGGAGYIGSHVCKALAGWGYRPVVYDNLIHGHSWAVKWGPFELGDVCDFARLTEVIAKHRPVAVMHFAALAYIGESTQEPAKYYRNNVAGTLTLLDAMRAADIHQLVFSSTCATYGIADTLPISESQYQKPINPYGSSKLMIERILSDYDAAYGLRSVALRYFNAAGADPDLEIGEVHEPETHLIPLLLDVVLGRRAHISVFGTDYPTADGTCVRDYLHVSDIADAHVLALQRLLAGKPTRSFNLGNGSGTSVDKVIQAAREVTGRTIRVETAAQRQGDPPILVGDASEAHRALGWEPRYTEFPTIVEHAWRWHRHYFA